MTVLHFQPSLYELNRRGVDGILRFARTAGWKVQIIEYDASVRDSLKSPRFEEPIDVAKLVSFWNPAGCIVDCGGRDRIFREIECLDDVPVVYFDLKKEGGVHPDNHAIATLAARELMSLGLEDYACLAWPEPLWWSEERRDSFAGWVRMNGKRLHEYRHGTARIPAMLHSELVSWSRNLPRPCGVFAVNDPLGRSFIEAVTCAGYSVPEDFAVVGVDDDARLCENSVISLSSVRWDAEKAGFLCARQLANLIADPKRKLEGVCVDTVTLTRRASTRLFRVFDIRVRNALEFIRRNAVEGIRPKDVVEVMGCSRRLADLRFREITGRTILDEIQAVKLERVMTLLNRPNLTLSVIPHMCGYGSQTDLQRVFKKHTGMTLRDYRKRFAAE